MGKMTEDVHHLIDKSTEDIKTSTKAISVGLERLEELNKLAAIPEEPLPLEAQ
jgi:predicted transcriptional regulator